MRRPNPADPDELYFSNFYVLVLVLVLVLLVLLLLSSPERKASQLCRLRAVRLRAGSAGIQHRRPPPQSVGAVSWFWFYLVLTPDEI